MSRTLPSVMWLMLALASSIACSHSVRTAQPKIVAHGVGYTYVQEQPDEYLVWADSNDALKRAVRDIGCGLCTEESRGFVMRIKRVRHK